MALAAEDALSFVAGLDERAFLASDLHRSAVIRKPQCVTGAGRRARIWVPQIREVKAAAARVTPGAGSEETNRNQHQPASGSGWGGALAGSRARATKSSSCGR